MVLVLVLVVIAMLSLAALTYSELMLTEREAAHLSHRQAQARVLAESGVDAARVFLGWDSQTQYDLGGWYHNPERFQGVLVIDDTLARGRGRYTFVAPDAEAGTSGGIRYGLEDESTRLNLNVLLKLEEYGEQLGIENAARQILMGLPGMNEYIADAVLDWIDEDDVAREYGAEVEYYSSLDPPYAPKNGYLETVEELLLVRDVTPWLLFGADANRNGYADAGEPDPSAIPGVDNSDRSMDRGWSAYLTLHSLETNLQPDGQPRIDLNQDNLETLYGELETAFGTEWATFIVAYRQQEEPYEGEPGPQDNVEEVPSGELDLSKAGKLKLQTVLDLIGQRVKLRYKDAEEDTILEPSFPDDPDLMRTYLPTLMDPVTVNPSTLIPGRINVNQAPRAVLSGIPGMTTEILEEILARRQADPASADTSRRHETWLLSEGIASLDEMKALMPFVTAGGAVFRGQAVGYFEKDAPVARIEVILDATSSPARVVFWRDLSHLGRGYSLETLGVAASGW